MKRADRSYWISLTFWGLMFVLSVIGMGLMVYELIRLIGG